MFKVNIGVKFFMILAHIGVGCIGKYTSMILWKRFAIRASWRCISGSDSISMFNKLRCCERFDVFFTTAAQTWSSIIDLEHQEQEMALLARSNFTCPRVLILHYLQVFMLFLRLGRGGAIWWVGVATRSYGLCALLRMAGSSDCTRKRCVQMGQALVFLFPNFFRIFGVP